MPKEKTCPVCGEIFISAGRNQKYCSEECRAKNAPNVYAAWAERTGYREKQRDKMRERRAKDVTILSAEREKQQTERAAEVNARIEQAKADSRADLERRAASGDLFAQMQFALINHDGALYWELRELWVEAERARVRAMFSNNN